MRAFFFTSAVVPALVLDAVRFSCSMQLVAARRSAAPFLSTSASSGTPAPAAAESRQLPGGSRLWRNACKRRLLSPSSSEGEQSPRQQEGDTDTDTTPRKSSTTTTSAGSQGLERVLESGLLANLLSAAGGGAVLAPLEGSCKSLKEALSVALRENPKLSAPQRLWAAYKEKAAQARRRLRQKRLALPNDYRISLSRDEGGVKAFRYAKAVTATGSDVVLFHQGIDLAGYFFDTKLLLEQNAGSSSSRSSTRSASPGGATSCPTVVLRQGAVVRIRTTKMPIPLQNIEDKRLYLESAAADRNTVVARGLITGAFARQRTKPLGIVVCMHRAGDGEPVYVVAVYLPLLPGWTSMTLQRDHEQTGAPHAETSWEYIDVPAKFLRFLGPVAVARSRSACSPRRTWFGLASPSAGEKTTLRWRDEDMPFDVLDDADEYEDEPPLDPDGDDATSTIFSASMSRRKSHDQEAACKAMRSTGVGAKMEAQFEAALEPLLPREDDSNNPPWDSSEEE